MPHSGIVNDATYFSGFKKEIEVGCLRKYTDKIWMEHFVLYRSIDAPELCLEFFKKLRVSKSMFFEHICNGNLSHRVTDTNFLMKM